MNRRKFIYNSSLASLSVVGLNSCNLLNEDVKLTILHTNDVHSQIEPFPLNHNKYPDRGGFARRANIFKYLMKINPNTLIFDAGDIFQGTPYFNFFKGELELNLMKKMGYNAATIGNHEFDAGLSSLKTNILNNDFQFISSSENNAWLLNIRGRDTKYTPIPYSYILIDKHKKVKFFCNPKKLSLSFKKYFNKVEFIKINFTY